MLAAFSTLLGFQLLGTSAVLALHLPIPGPVGGLFLLALWLFARGPTPLELPETANQLIAHLSLLFVPAATGIVQHLERLRAEGAVLFIAVVGSTALALIVGALTFVLMVRLTQSPPQADEVKS
jgi:holin-like protein